MTILLSLHVHTETVDTHDDCLQCAGHFEPHHHHGHDCLYCHFLGLDYLGQAAGESFQLLSATDRHPSAVVETSPRVHHWVSLLRAPPVA